ncbi:DUF1534 domain-containing protein [Pseudomonas cannabina]|nr:DUF1534 domain-containing protein [Pseudomonas cannabina]
MPHLAREEAVQPVTLSFLTLQRRNAVLDALRRNEDAERPERHTTRSVAR